MSVRRYTRLTLSYSKTYRHHAAMTALFVAWYNFCRRHETLGISRGTRGESGMRSKLQLRAPLVRFVFERLSDVEIDNPLPGIGDVGFGMNGNRGFPGA